MCNLGAKCVVNHKKQPYMTIQRPKYLDMLTAGQGNGLVKIVTGGRRCGKSFLLFVLFRNYLLRQGVEEDHINRDFA